MDSLLVVIEQQANDTFVTQCQVKNYKLYTRIPLLSSQEIRSTSPFRRPRSSVLVIISFPLYPNTSVLNVTTGVSPPFIEATTSSSIV